MHFRFASYFYAAYFAFLFLVLIKYRRFQDNKVHVFDVNTARIIEQLPGHSGVIRDLHVAAELGMLLSCGFDKSIRFWV